MATKTMVAKKVADINNLLNHKFTNEELNEKLRKQGTLDSKMSTFKRIETERQLQAARASGDEAEIEKLEEQMKEYTLPKLAFGTSLHKPRSEKKTEQERLADLNLRNQRLNYENVRRAQLEERKASRKAAAAVARGEMPADPFQRVKTRVKTHHDFNSPSGIKEEGGSNVGSGTDSPARINTPKDGSGTSTPKKNGGFSIRHRKTDDENIAALDFELDIDI